MDVDDTNTKVEGPKGVGPRRRSIGHSSTVFPPSALTLDTSKNGVYLFKGHVLQKIITKLVRRACS